MKAKLSYQNIKTTSRQINIIQKQHQHFKNDTKTRETNQDSRDHKIHDVTHSTTFSSSVVCWPSTSWCQSVSLS